MIENRANSNNFREAVCIEAQRIFDSCSDKDCLEDLEVIFTDGAAKTIIDNATFIKCKNVEVINTYFTIEPVPFNKGFYSIDITYFFNVVIEAYTSSTTTPQTVSGSAQFCKKVILYGSDGNAKIFRSDETTTPAPQNLPIATVQVVEPIVLDAKLVTKTLRCQDCCCPTQSVDPTVTTPDKRVFITLGIFSIISLIRPVSLLIPSYDYCIPHKDCSTSNDSPCELFEKIKFPSNEFFPLSLEDVKDDESDNRD